MSWICGPYHMSVKIDTEKNWTLKFEEHTRIPNQHNQTNLNRLVCVLLLIALTVGTIVPSCDLEWKWVWKMSSNGNFLAQLQKLNVKNWDQWHVHMKALFDFQEVTKIINLEHLFLNQWWCNWCEGNIQRKQEERAQIIVFNTSKCRWYKLW